MSVSRALFGPCSYLVRLQCVSSASVDALETHWTRSNPGEKQDESRQKPGKKAAFLKQEIKQGL